MARAAPIRYDLADIFRDQPMWFGRETIPPMLAWLGEPTPPLRFLLRQGRAETPLELHWRTTALRDAIPGLDDEVARLVSRRSVRLEQIPQYGAYALAGVLASAILERKVVSLGQWVAPDLLFDETPGALCGVEVAGRSTGGLRELNKLGAQKSVSMASRDDVAEAWISLWCATPRVSLCLKARG